MSAVTFSRKATATLILAIAIAFSIVGTAFAYDANISGTCDGYSCYGSSQISSTYGRAITSFFTPGGLTASVEASYQEYVDGIWSFPPYRIDRVYRTASGTSINATAYRPSGDTYRMYGAVGIHTVTHGGYNWTEITHTFR